MSDKIYDDLKKIHDTPRADKAFICAETSGNLNWDIYQEARLLEKEMNQYKTHIEFQDKRIKQLEDIINRASIRFFQDGSDGKTAVQMLDILDEARL